jgi:hypothetical protein
MAKPSSYGLALLACVAVAAAVAGGTQFTVGGANGWSVPAAGAEPFNAWAERTRFQIGDALGNWLTIYMRVRARETPRRTRLALVMQLVVYWFSVCSCLCP